MLNIENNTSFVLTLFVICFFYKSLNYLNRINDQLNCFDYLFEYARYICDNYEDILNHMNEVLYCGLIYDYSDVNDNESEKDENNEIEETNKKIIKYEDKYLDEIRKMEKEYILTDSESEVYENKFNIAYHFIIESYNTKIQTLEEQIKEFKQEIADFECMTDVDSTNNDSSNENRDSINSNDSTYINNFNISKNDKINTLNEYVKEKENEKFFIQEKLNDIESIEITSKKIALDAIIQERLEKLKGSYVIEHTPLGNVLMTYNIERETFTYYSDVTVPYRYLEVVSRKYVKFFNCRQLYVDMEDELKNYQQKLQEKREREEMEKEEKRKESELNNVVTEPKKNVFVKLKSYNKGSGRVITSAPPKNSIPNRIQLEKEKSDNILLKDNANRYTYEGKISNFNILKKIERKVVDKKYGMTFSDFKQMQQKKM